MEKKQLKLLGFEIDTFDLKDSVKYALDLVQTKQGGQVVTINPEMIEYGLKHGDFFQIVKNAKLVIPDGIGIKLGLLLEGHNVKRVAGIEFSYQLLEECAKNNIPVAMIGAKPKILTQATKKLKEKINGLNIVYTHDGYYKDVEKVYWGMGEKKPRVILVALGSPKQEVFIRDYMKDHHEVLMIGVGGSFDVWSGVVKRAPKLFQQLGIEWLYRVVTEPARLKRIFPVLPRFLIRVIFSSL